MSCGHSRSARPTASMSEARDSAPAGRQRFGSDTTRRRGRMFGATRVDALGGVICVGAPPTVDGPTLADAEPTRQVIESRAAAITTRRGNMSPSVPGRAGLHVGRVGALFELGAQALDELRIVAGLEDLVELAAVVRDQAHALDRHVVGLPPVTVGEHPVVDRNLGALLGDDARADDG